MVDFGSAFFLWRLDEDPDGNALLDVKDVLVLRAVGGALLLLGVAVKIQDVDLAVGFHELLAHSSEGRVVKITVVGYKGQNTPTSLFNPPLTPANELDVIILEPLRSSLS